MNPGRLPIEQPQSVLHPCHNGGHVLDPGGLACSREGNAAGIAGESVLGGWARCRPVRLGNHESLAPSASHVRQARLERRQCRGRIIKRIIGDTHDVKVRCDQGAGRKHCLVEVLLSAPVPAVVEVNHDLRLWVQRRVFDAPGGRMQQPRDVGVGGCRPRREQQSSRDLIADRDDLWLDAIALELIRDVERIVVQLPCEIVNRSRPSGWYRLMSRICPGVTIVQIQIHSKPSSLGPLRKLEVVREVVVSV